MTVPVVRFVVAGHEQFAFRRVRPYTVIYDGECNMCGRLVGLLRGWDKQGKLEIIPSQAAGVRSRFPWIPQQAYRESVQLIGPNGETWQGAPAIEQLLDVLPKGKLLSWIFSVPGVRPLAQRGYRWVARNRYRLGCGDHCRYRPEAVDFGDEP